MKRIAFEAQKPECKRRQ